jgi:MscS family membrane protein
MNYACLLNIFNPDCYSKSLYDYAIYVGIILLVWLLRHVFSKIITAVLYNIVHRQAEEVTKKEFRSLLSKPVSWFWVLFISLIILDKLPFPPCWNFTLFNNITLFAIVDALLVIAIITSIVWIITRMVDFFAVLLHYKAERTPDMADNQLIIFFKDFIKVVLWIFGILFMIKFAFKQSIGQLLTGLSLVGAAIALATRESLENLIASFIIFFDKPFSVGDTVKVQQVNGTVEHIGLRSTRIRTLDKTYVSVPNKQMVDSIVDNQSNRTQRRFVLEIDCEPNVDVSAFKNAIKDIYDIRNNINAIEKLTAHVSQLHKQGVQLHIECVMYNMESEVFNNLRQQCILAIYNILRDRNIQITKP